MAETIKTRRAVLGLSQAELAERVGVDKRQIRRYEASEAQPTLPVARDIADALGISLDELAGSDTRRVGLSGEWWAAWQTYQDGQEVHTVQQITIRQRGDFIQLATEDRGNVTLEEGGYNWQGEARLSDNELLIGSYAATDGAVRSQGSLFFHLHPHGQHMTGRWVGLSHDGPLVTGQATIAKTRDAALNNLNTTEGSTP
ncbi:MAG: helix-turn-helix transcriptional regulator [Ornithinimicrobium sp.]